MADVPYCVRGCGRRAITEGRLIGWSDYPIVELVCIRHTPWARVARYRVIVVRRHIDRLRRLWRTSKGEHSVGNTRRSRTRHTGTTGATVLHLKSVRRSRR